MLSLKLIEKSSEASSVMMAEKFRIMITTFRDLEVPPDDILDGLLVGIEDLKKEYRKENPDANETMDNFVTQFQGMMDQLKAAVKARRV